MEDLTFLATGPQLISPNLRKSLWKLKLLRRPEGPSQAKRHLGYPNQNATWSPHKGVALFDLGLNSTLRAFDLVRLRVRDICHGDRVSTRAIIMRQKTSQPVQFETTPPTKDAVTEWIKAAELKNDDYLLPSRVHDSPHLGTRQYARTLDNWIEEIGLDPTSYGICTIRRTKASLIYRRTKNIRAVQ